MPLDKERHRVEPETYLMREKWRAIVHAIATGIRKNGAVFIADALVDV